MAVGILGLLALGYVFFAGATRPVYACETQLQPGPSGASPSPTPPTAPPLATPTETGAESRSPATSPEGSPGATGAATTSPAGGTTGASPTPSAGASPFGSPVAPAGQTAAASPGASPTASPSPSPLPEPTPLSGFAPPDLGREHVTDASSTLEYGHCPPTSGPHFALGTLNVLQRDFYGPGGEQNPGEWVHNLEHGYVVGLYSCRDGCPSDEQLEQMRRFFNEAPSSEGAERCGLPNKVLVVRFDQMPTRFAVVAWNRALLMDTFDVQQAITFAQQYTDAPWTPEAGAC